MIMGVKSTEIFTKRFAIFFVLCLILSNTVNSQVLEKTEVDSVDKKRSDRLAFLVAYFGETITHPGFNLGVEYSLWEKKKLMLLSSVNLGAYTHPRHHRALFTNLKAGLRFTTSYGLYTDIFVGIGYHHSWVNGDVYVSDGSNDAKIIWDRGRSHLMLDASLGLGWDLSKRSSSNLKIFLRINPFYLYPVNHNMLMQAALMGGVIWPL